MKMQEISKRYARALFEAAESSQKAPQVLEQIQVLAKAISADSEITTFFKSPMNHSDSKHKVLEHLLQKMKFSEEVSQFLKILIENDRVPFLQEIVECYQGLIDDLQGVVRGKVITAKPLSEESKKDLMGTISNVAHKKVILDYEIDESVIGGVVANVQGLTLNDSLQRHLTRMNEELNRRSE